MRFQWWQTVLLECDSDLEKVAVIDKKLIFNISALAGILLKSGNVYFFSEQFFGRSE